MLCLATGVGFYVWGYRYPWFNVPEDEVWDLSSRLEGKPHDQRFREWYLERKKLETPRKSIQDAGQGLVALSLILAILRISSGFPLEDAISPRWRWLFIATYLAALAVQFPASIFYYVQRQARHDYPTWGDSIVIGIAQSSLTAMFYAAVGCVLWLPFLAKVRFPAPLFAWPSNQTRFNMIVTIGCGLFTALCLWMTPYYVIDGNVGPIIMTVVLAYLFLSLRAGLVLGHAEQTKERVRC